ncbi:MarR family winged helix-turn-helix transcriptional regulator [Microbacterium trichothecenolyticum]|uniref:DNA-binding MarR family transcriptional regulator n=1 Tax=Microbacterium trichothecenolyticum TaxID=69370 RepID=A0ABU0TY68_MICTR|nr:MarR family transcriptional regulator [Microbacterium trichothecenolyticum]MDQ1124600.1 DNA-binding MarR family transcriptional regulator [Microbacterium trichothecenolyticum]
MTNPSVLTAALDEYVGVRDAAIAKARADLAVSELEARALRCIADEPGIRPSVLRTRLGVTAAGVTTMVDRLIVRGLVRRELDAEDRRVNHIHLEVDLDREPWVALGRFSTEVDAAVHAEPRESIEAATELLRRLTERVRALT